MKAYRLFSKQSRDIPLESFNNIDIDENLSLILRESNLINSNENNQFIHPRLSAVLSTSQIFRQQVYIKEVLRLIDNNENDINEFKKYSNTLNTVHFEIRNINFEIYPSNFSVLCKGTKRNSPVKILNNVNAIFEPSSFTAILGPSGSGKSTLLQSICGYYHLSFKKKLTGEIFIQFQKVKNGDFHIQKLSVMEQFGENFLYPYLTVKETLLFAAQFQLSPSISYHQKVKLVNALLGVLRLKEVENSVIGPIEFRGLSGGQLRRLSMGVEILLKRSKLILLDEPTSGLSASGSAEVISVLQCLADLLL